jgi:hypothetical protein
LAFDGTINHGRVAQLYSELLGETAADRVQVHAA